MDVTCRFAAEHVIPGPEELASTRNLLFEAVY